MVSELVATVAVLSALIGAVFSTIRAWYKAPDTTGFSHKKLISALITSGFVTLGLVNLTNLPEPSSLGFLWTGIIASNLLIGWGVDKALSGLDK